MYKHKWIATLELTDNIKLIFQLSQRDRYKTRYKTTWQTRIIFSKRSIEYLDKNIIPSSYYHYQEQRHIQNNNII